jgi:threonine/homoserine/homoserine lactone efflux protein
MLVAIGVIVLLMGVLALLFGGRQVGAAGGLIAKIFSWPRGMNRWVRYGCGAALIYAGVMIILRALGYSN